MNISRTVLIGVAGGALVAWFAAASTSGTRPAMTITTPRAATIDKSGAALAEEIERLHERLHPTATPEQPARNLFEYGARVAHAAAPASRVALPAAVDERVQPAAPVISLIGIAEDAGVRTAILSGAGQVSLVKEGERVDRYTVVRIEPTFVELGDPAAGTLRLDLK
jgi:hypothetical protein